MTKTNYCEIVYNFLQHSDLLEAFIYDASHYPNLSHDTILDYDPINYSITWSGSRKGYDIWDIADSNLLTVLNPYTFEEYPSIQELLDYLKNYNHSIPNTPYEYW